MEKYIGIGVSKDLNKALEDARASISIEEQQTYDAVTLEEMFQHQFNVNLRSAADSRTAKNQLKTAEALENFAQYGFPDYNEILDTKGMVRQNQVLVRSFNKILSDIRHLPALENEEPFDPNPWPDYNQILDVAGATRRAEDDIKSVKDILSAIKMMPALEEGSKTGEMTMQDVMDHHDASIALKKMMSRLARVDLLKDEEPTKSSPASDKDRRQPDGPQPV